MSTGNGRVSSPRLTEDEINELLLRLQAKLPNSSTLRSNPRASPSRILKEACNYIKTLSREVDALSESLSQLIPPPGGEVTVMDDAEVIRRFLQQ